MANPSPLSPFFEDQTVIVLDGALATELEARGYALDEDLWSASLLPNEPDAIRRLHYDYFCAGADIAISASYQSSFEGFARLGLETEEAASLMRRSVELACEARDRFWAEPANRRRRVRPLVAASIGCYGAFLSDGSEYRGDYGLTQAELVDWHRPRLETLLSSGADLLACETIPCAVEARALVELLADYPEARAWISFSCCDGDSLCSGESFAPIVHEVAGSAQVIAVGLNCTPPRHVESLLRSVGEEIPIPLVVYPNSGERWDGQNHCWVEGSGVTDFAALAIIWRRAGARIIGGCCRTGPGEITALRRALL